MKNVDVVSLLRGGINKLSLLTYRQFIKRALLTTDNGACMHWPRKHQYHFHFLLKEAMLSVFVVSCDYTVPKRSMILIHILCSDEQLTSIIQISFFCFREKNVWNHFFCSSSNEHSNFSISFLFPYFTVLLPINCVVGPLACTETPLWNNVYRLCMDTRASALGWFTLCSIGCVAVT